MNEILPGLFHWTAVHPKIHVEVSSYYLRAGGVLLDPLLPPDGLEAFRRHGEPSHVILTNRHHYRHSDRFEQVFGCTVWCNEEGLHEFTRGEKVRGFRAGDALPGDIQSHPVGVICPDETALWLPVESGALAVADGVIRHGEGALDFVPDSLLGDDPEQVKRGLKAAYARLLELEFAHLLLAHGLPQLGSGKQALDAFVSSPAD